MPARSDGLPDSERPSQRLRSTGTRARRCAVVMAPIVLTACQPAVLDPQGPIGFAEKTILIDSLAIMLAIVVPTIAATLGFAWWFRASNTRAIYLPDFEYSGRIELIVWSIPLLTVILLAAWPGSDPMTSIQQSRWHQTRHRSRSRRFRWIGSGSSSSGASVSRA